MPESGTSDERQGTTDDYDGATDRTGRVGRREFLAAGSAATALAAAGCVGGGSGGDTLTVSTWSGTNENIFRETIKPRYEDRTGNELEVVGNWNNILGQLRQSPSDDPPFDLTIGSVRDHYLGEQDDLWEPVREENVPNVEAVKPALLETTQSGSSVPVDYGVMGYAYDEDAVASEPETWTDLVAEGTPEKFALPATYFLNAMIMAAIVTDEAPGAGELYSEADRDIDAIFETMSEMPVAKFYQGAQDLWTSMQEGVANAGQYFYAYSLAKADETSEMNIGVHVPDRTLGYVDHYQVARGTSNRQQAEEFINFLLREEIQTEYAEAFNLGMANENADHPDRTAEAVPIENDEFDEVVLKTYYQIAEAAPNLDERFKEFQTNQS